MKRYHGTKFLDRENRELFQPRWKIRTALIVLAMVFTKQLNIKQAGSVEALVSPPAVSLHGLYDSQRQRKWSIDRHEGRSTIYLRCSKNFREGKSTSTTKGLSSYSSKKSYSTLTPDEQLMLLETISVCRSLRAIRSRHEHSRGMAVTLSEWAKIVGSPSVDALKRELHRGKMAKNELIVKNMGLVHLVVSKYVKKPRMNFDVTHERSVSRFESLTYDDLVQEGCIGLSRAINKFDLNANTKFSTYALYWIRASVLRAISSQNELIRVPEHVTQTIRKIQVASRRLRLDLDLHDESGLSSNALRSVTTERALAFEAGVTVNQLQEALRVARRRGMMDKNRGGYVQYEPWMQSIMIDRIEKEGSNYGTHAIKREDLREALSKFLRPKEMQALSLRYGLDDTCSSDGTSLVLRKRPFRDYEAEAEAEIFSVDSEAKENLSAASKEISRNCQHAQVAKQGRWGEAMSFQEVGKRMAVSGEYGRRLCSIALEKLRHAAQDGLLQPELLI